MAVRRTLVFFLLALLCWPGAALADGSVRVLTLNIWGGGLHRGWSIADTAAVLRASGADVIGLQEVWGVIPTSCATAACADNNATPSLACAIARELEFHCHNQEIAAARVVNAVLSRHRITGATPSGLGVRIEIGGRPLTLFNLHLPDSPYQPYQLLRIAYDGSPWLTTADGAVAAASTARGRVIDTLERELAAAGDGPVVITADLNEPSFRDWTPRSAALGIHPVAVPWPVTRRLEKLGFTDAYRAIFPDEIDHPGFTWSPYPADEDHADRIDFVFARGPGLRITDAAVLGEARPAADIVVAPWPTDHRGVVATLRFGPDIERIIAWAAERDR